MKSKHWLLILIPASLGNFFNAIWMMSDPGGWYLYLPAAVPDFGPLNEHFVRDLGAMFLIWGLALLWAAFSEKHRFVLLALIAMWNGLHALVHPFDTLRGLVASEHWLIDFPMVYAPTAIYVLLAWLARSGPRREAISDSAGSDEWAEQ